MAIVRYSGDRYTGVSGDTKPTNVSDGAEFIETDNKNIYIKVSGAWEACASISITIANEATDTTCFIPFVTAATGNLPLKSNAGLIFDSSRGRLGAVSLKLTGDTAGILAVGGDFYDHCLMTIGYNGNPLDQTHQVGCYSAVKGNSYATGAGSFVAGFETAIGTAVGVTTLAVACNYSASGLTVGSGSTITRFINYAINDEAGATYNAQFAAIDAAFTANWFMYYTGTRASYIGGALTVIGNVGVGLTSSGHKLEVLGGSASNVEMGVWEGSSTWTTLSLNGDMNLGANFYSSPTQPLCINRPTGYDISFRENNTQQVIIKTSTGYVGINTATPEAPLAINRLADDGTVIDIEQADTVEGNISVSGNTVSYNAFVGSHYTQLKPNQTEFPIGAVVISTGDIIPCSNHSKTTEVEVPFSQAITIVTKSEAIQTYTTEVEDKDNITSSSPEYEYNFETDTTKEKLVSVYGTKIVSKRRLKVGYYHNKITNEFYKINDGYITKDNKFYLVGTVNKDYPGKEYFVYVNTTNNAADKRVYGVWFGKLADNSQEMSFGNPNKPVYLIAQVGLFKVRVTDSSGDISNGDYLETSTRPMEAQKQTGNTNKKSSTVAKALTNVIWDNEPVDPILGYKWKLIPCIF